MHWNRDCSEYITLPGRTVIVTSWAKVLHTQTKDIQLASVKRGIAQVLWVAKEDGIEAGSLAETYRLRLEA